MSAAVAVAAIRAARPPRPWYVYLIECRNGAIYCGIAPDVAARYAKHCAGKGARYTRSNPPVRLLATFAHADRAAALRAEYAMKQLSASAKRALVRSVD